MKTAINSGTAINKMCSGLLTISSFSKAEQQISFSKDEVGDRFKDYGGGYGD
jgi:hypothetical protein